VSRKRCCGLSLLMIFMEIHRFQLAIEIDVRWEFSRRQTLSAEGEPIALDATAFRR